MKLIIWAQKRLELVGACVEEYLRSDTEVRAAEWSFGVAEAEEDQGVAVVDAGVGVALKIRHYCVRNPEKRKVVVEVGDGVRGFLYTQPTAFQIESETRVGW